MQFNTYSASITAKSTDLRLGSSQVIDFLNANTELANVAINWQANALDLAISINTR